ncbi:ABC transporter ATP-binding protein [Macrococcus equipercicus]|uniref:Putative hemin import ATP-binding protein HrtA n=1 Tax=Macrococcus equipercicus TaxID=69967 RepID=A0ABQ6R6T2_9STAP|nr:ABC transporter ATP-binding protein [Macrococcus equipercicus]KAA1037577.1 ABC transporter ATP-binding protein [Macrococcus equipercicus]
MVLTLTEVNKSFGKDQTYVEALKPVDFNINAGEMAAVIGPSGSGKSTFLTIAGLLQQPTNGKVIINNQDVSKLSERQRAKIRLKHIGFILQSSNLVPFLKVKDQFKLLAQVNKNHIQPADFNNQVETLGLTAVMNQFPAELSGGQRQRVAILKAMYTNPSLILADEPTASLDSARAYEVIEMIQRIVKETNKAAIIVTHDNRLLDYFDKVYVMEDGNLTLQD